MNSHRLVLSNEHTAIQAKTKDEETEPGHGDLPGENSQNVNRGQTG